MTEAVPSYLSPTGQEIVFLLLGAVAVGSALLVVMTKQIVHAALWLVVCFGALAGGYLVLTAEFVAWVQVLIYVGAIIVLLLFGIMLTRAPIGRSDDLDSGNKAVAAVVAVATAAILVTVVIDGFRTAYTPLTPGHGAAGELGAGIFATWVLPFEALSVLLLAALIGAIVLSRTDISAPAPASGGPPGTQPDVGGSGVTPDGGSSGPAPDATHSGVAPGGTGPGSALDGAHSGGAPAGTAPGVVGNGTDSGPPSDGAGSGVAPGGTSRSETGSGAARTDPTATTRGADSAAATEGADSAATMEGTGSGAERTAQESAPPGRPLSASSSDRAASAAPTGTGPEVSSDDRTDGGTPPDQTGRQ